MTLTIEHTEAEGTLLVGTARGDGSADVVKALGWRWGRNLGLWFIPRSRDTAPKRALIERSAQALREAGFTVEVSIDATVGDREEAEARREQRADERTDRLAERAEREQTQANARYAAARDLADRIPFGQPILLGHHSQGRAQRDAAKIRGGFDASLAHQRQADDLSRARDIAAAATDARNNPVTVANRIDKLAADIRRDERALTAYDATNSDTQTLYRLTLTDRLAVARADLEHWQAVRAHQISTGAATHYGPQTVKPGDLVKIRESWRRVVRANAKTVSVETPYSWTDKAPWQEVQDHRTPQTAVQATETAEAAR